MSLPQVRRPTSFGDVARMKRLIDQLLRVARLDSAPMLVDASVDLKAVAAETVKYLAPWAIDHGWSIGFDAPDSPVLVRGNADATADALRNLVENAVYQTPPRTEVTVTVTENGSVEVTDRDPASPTKIASASSSGSGAGLRSKRPGPVSG
jgi:signal transduction histidine kinase